MSERMAGAVAGSVFAGLALTALLVVMERRSGTVNEIVALERASARRLGFEVPDAEAMPGAGEQLFAQGGHLILSAAGGAAYATLTDRDAPALSSGILFGLGFYALLQWIVGPLLRVKHPEWQSDGATIVMHATNHVLFGVITAAFAKAASRLR